jgi:hypothetical protein
MRKILNDLGEKEQITFKGTTVRLIADFSIKK